MRCDEFRHHLTALVNGSIDGEIRRELALHMVACGACAGLVEDETFWTDAVRQVLDHKAPDDLRAALLAADRARPGAAERGRIWGAIARYVWQDMTWRTWAEVLAVTAAVMFAVNWLGGRGGEDPAGFGHSGPVVMIAEPPADPNPVANGSYYLTDRLF